MQHDESSNSTDQGQDEQESVGETSINHLPAEMLTQILKCVDTQDLYKCRKVNRGWNEISSRILCKRSDALVHFKFNGDFECKVKLTCQGKGIKEEEKASLEEFVQTFKDSKTCPIAHFHFDIESGKVLEFLHHDEWLEFLDQFGNSPQKENQNQNQNQKIKDLSLNINHISEIESFHVLIEKLRSLLRNQLVHLEALDLDFWTQLEDSNIRLFRDTDKIQLAHLKEVSFTPLVGRAFPRVFNDLLDAAVNVRTVYVHPNYEDQTLDLTALLHSRGNPYIIPVAWFSLTDLLSLSEKCKTGPLRLQWKELIVNLGRTEEIVKIRNDPKSLSAAMDFLSKMLESSKEILEHLDLQSLPFLIEAGLAFPTFTKLGKLYIEQLATPFHSQQPVSVFPPEMQSLVFQTVVYLDLRVLDFSLGFPQPDSIPVFSRVETLSVKDEGLNQEAIFTLSLLCPNLKHLNIEKTGFGPPKIPFSQWSRAIWTLFPHLESLDIGVFLDAPENSSAPLDSFFTGIPVENCQQLIELRSELANNNTMVDNCESRVNIPELISQLTTVRDHPSILDMKDLRKLTITPYVRGRCGAKWLSPEEFYSKKFMWISIEFGFKLMPRLQVFWDLEEENN